MTALAASASRAAATAGLGVGAPGPAAAAAAIATDRSPAISRLVKPVRSWPLLILAVPAAAEVWSGWVGIAQKTGFGLVSPLPGLWPSLHIDTAITLPIGVEAYAAYALRAWLSSGHAVSTRTRRFAKWSAIFSFALGMAGQVAYHLLAQAGMARAPWTITTIVSCLPVMVLAMGTTLAHMLHADAAVAGWPGNEAGCAVSDPHPGCTSEHQPQPRGDHVVHDEAPADSGPVAESPGSMCWDNGVAQGITMSGQPAPQPDVDQARLITRRLVADGKPVSRRALRSSGIRGSNEALNALARELKAEHAIKSGGPSHAPRHVSHAEHGLPNQRSAEGNDLAVLAATTR